ncbi:MAG: hypothetical protein ACOC7K_01060 [bacterium]
MEEEKDFVSGVASVFDAIASQSKAEKKPRDDEMRTRAARNETPLADQASTRGQEERKKRSQSRPKARIGRFPGSRNGEPKEKITGRVAPELKDAYVDWALDDRCPLSDLMERALTEFFERHRTETTAGK